MTSVAHGRLALFALAVSSGVAFAHCAGHVVPTNSTTVATTDGSTPITVPTTRAGG
jgi:hypothetical protein